MRLFKVFMATVIMTVALFGMSNTTHAERWEHVKDVFYIDLDSIEKDYEYLDHSNGGQWYIAGHAQVRNSSSGVTKTWYAQNYNGDGVRDGLYLRMGYGNTMRKVRLQDGTEYFVANRILSWFSPI